jgi:hypothetical protein
MCATQQLKYIHINITMNRVDAILSLQSELRDPTISMNVLRAIQTVQEAILKTTETQGWKRVDWRGSGGSSSSSSNNSSSSNTNPRSTFNKFRGPGGSSAPAAGSSPIPKYVSRFKKTGEADDAVLMLIQDKLNKFSPRNYKEIFEFLCQILDSGKTDFLKDFMKFVFQKATREQSFCPYYAQLLCELTGKYSVLLTEMTARYREFGAIFEDISELETDSYSELLSSNSDKAYRQGYAQFLGELVKYNVLDTELFVATIRSIIQNIQRMSANEKGKPVLEEYVICLTRIVSSVKEGSTELAKALRAKMKEQFIAELSPLTIKDPDLIGISARSRFTMMDVVDMIKTF